MPGALITNLTHFLDERGCIAPANGRARRLAEFLTHVVSTMTHDLDAPLGLIRCRRRPGRKLCPGLVGASFGEHDEIFWECPLCHDHGVITEWQDTFWDLMHAPSAQPDP
jgi:hypothetical protein